MGRCTCCKFRKSAAAVCLAPSHSKSFHSSLFTQPSAWMINGCIRAVVPCNVQLGTGRLVVHEDACRLVVLQKRLALTMRVLRHILVAASLARLLLQWCTQADPKMIHTLKGQMSTTSLYVQMPGSLNANEDHASGTAVRQTRPQEDPAAAAPADKVRPQHSAQMT